MRNLVFVCVVVLVFSAGLLILHAGVDTATLGRMFTSLPFAQQFALAVATIVLALLVGAAVFQSDRLMRQGAVIGKLTERLDGVRQSTSTLTEAQTGLDAALRRAEGSDPEEALQSLGKRLTEAERATSLQQSHNEAVDLESRADDIRRRQQALRGRLGEVFNKRRLIEPIFGELKERQSIIDRSLHDFDKGEGAKSLETHLKELTEFVRRTEERFQTFDQGLVTLDRIKTEITGLQGRIAPLESSETGIKPVIQGVCGLRDQLAVALERLEQDGDRTVSQRVQELGDQTREFEKRVAALCEHFVTLESVRTEIGVLFTRLNVALATHALGQKPAVTEQKPAMTEQKPAFLEQARPEPVNAPSFAEHQPSSSANH